MHKRLKQDVREIPSAILKTLDTYDGKIEYFYKYCRKCCDVRVHRFLIGDDLTLGTCEHEWGMSKDDIHIQQLLDSYSHNLAELGLQGDR